METWEFIKKYKKHILIGVLIALSLFLILYFLPFKYTIITVNEHEVQTNATISLYWHHHKIWTKYGSNVSFYLPSSAYQVEVEAYGFKKQKHTMKNRLFNFTFHKKDQFLLHPIYIPLARFNYYDPTGTVEIYPGFTVSGTTIQGDEAEQSFNQSPIIPFGYYSVKIFTPYFTTYASFEGDIYKDNTTELYLEPKEEYTIQEQDLTYIENFFHDYINLSLEDQMDSYFEGYPMQYYLYNNEEIMSLGDMFLLFCEKEAYQQSGRWPQYFIMPGKEYQIGGEEPCYTSLYSGYVPENLGNKFYGEELSYELPDLNQHNNLMPIAFSYDIESGRYVPSGHEGISPCESEIYAMGIDENEIDCEDADYMAWFTPTIGKQTLDDYPYPWVSGIKGFEDLIFLSTEYGIASTYYMVGKEVEVYEELNPTIVEQTRELAEQGLVEIGSHSYYHNRLGTHSIEFDTEQIELSKEYLEEKFDTEVIGIRGPYFSMIGDDPEINAEVLGEIGFEYCSNEWNDYEELAGEAINKHVNVYILTHEKQSKLRQIPEWYEHVITIDHPWNLYYDEFEEDDKVYLQENLDIADEYRALVLASVSYGYIPTLVKDIEIT